MTPIGRTAEHGDSCMFAAGKQGRPRSVKRGVPEGGESEGQGPQRWTSATYWIALGWWGEFE